MRTQNFMFAAVLATLITGATAIAADQPVFRPDGRGGFHLRIEARHLVNTNHGKMEGQVFVIPRDGTFRSCAASTPMIPVPHASGKLDVDIELEAAWVGFLDPVMGEDPDLFTAFIVVGSGDDEQRTRDYFHTGLMRKVVDYVESPRRVHTFASTEGFKIHRLPAVEVTDDDRAYIMICDIRPGASAKIKAINVHTYPFGN